MSTRSRNSKNNKQGTSQSPMTPSRDDDSAQEGDITMTAADDTMTIGQGAGAAAEVHPISPPVVQTATSDATNAQMFAQLLQQIQQVSQQMNEQQKTLKQELNERFDVQTQQMKQMNERFETQIVELKQKRLKSSSQGSVNNHIESIAGSDTKNIKSEKLDKSSNSGSCKT